MEVRMERNHSSATTTTLRRIDRLLHQLSCIQRQQHLHPLSPLFLMGKDLKQVEAIPVIIGGMVLDIHATTSIASSAKSTTPGKVDFMLGGVARNIAECLLKLGTKSYMISAVGSDMAGSMLLEQWRSSGLPIEGIQQSLEIKTATVCNMFDVNGELTSGVASVESIERYVTPHWIQQYKPVIYSAPVMLIDANLSPEALEASCRVAADYDVPVWFEPVSIPKSKRVASIANRITFVSPNEHELVAMANALTRESTFSAIPRDLEKTNGSIESLFQDLKPAVLVLLDKGIKFVLVTLGPHGTLLCSRRGPSCLKECFHGAKSFGGKKDLFDMVTNRCPTHRYSSSTPHKGGSQLFVMHFPALPIEVRRVSGAGDCLVSGVLASLCSGLNVMQSVAVGIAVAKAAIGVETNVPSKFDLTTVADDAGIVYKAAKVVFQESTL